MSKAYHGDHLGSTRGLTDGTQAVTDSRERDAFGLTVGSTGTTPTPFGFVGGQGYQSDGDSGLMLLGARYYDPSVGRFISRDPIRFYGGDVNLYGYCQNDPVNVTDPSGLGPVLYYLFVALMAGVCFSSGQNERGAEFALGDAADAYVVATGRDLSGDQVTLGAYLVTMILLMVPFITGAAFRDAVEAGEEYVRLWRGMDTRQADMLRDSGGVMLDPPPGIGHDGYLYLATRPPHPNDYPIDGPGEMWHIDVPQDAYRDAFERWASPEHIGYPSEELAVPYSMREEYRHFFEGWQPGY